MLVKHPRAYIFLLKDLKWELMALAALCILIGELDDNVYLLEEFSLSIPSFIGTALVITIAFRTNKAYHRWWEAKEIWQDITNATRALNRLSTVYLSKSDAELIVTRQAEWVYMLACRLRGLEYSDMHKSVFSKDEWDAILSADNPNQYILKLQSQSLSRHLNQGAIPQFVHLKMERTLLELEALMGKCERIKKTHFPHPYDLLIHISIYLFAIVSAYFISDDVTVFEAGVSFIVTAIFLSIHHIARQMQDPFENRPYDTPMFWHLHNLRNETKNLLGSTQTESVPHHFKTHIM